MTITLQHPRNSPSYTVGVYHFTPDSRGVNIIAYTQETDGGMGYAATYGNARKVYAKLLKAGWTRKT